jgi:ABC-type Na+ efflux pump permease subunit
VHPEAQTLFLLSFFMLIFIFSLLFVTVGYISDKALTEATSVEEPKP